MLNEYLPIVILILVAGFVAVAALVLGSLFGPRRPTVRKAEPYESGMRPFGPGRRRVPIHFYLIAVLFLLPVHGIVVELQAQAGAYQDPVNYIGVAIRALQ